MTSRFFRNKTIRRTDNLFFSLPRKFPLIELDENIRLLAKILELRIIDFPRKAKVAFILINKKQISSVSFGDSICLRHSQKQRNEICSICYGENVFVSLFLFCSAKTLAIGNNVYSKIIHYVLKEVCTNERYYFSPRNFERNKFLSSFRICFSCKITAYLSVVLCSRDSSSYNKNIYFHL